MKDILTYLAGQLVSHPEALLIDQDTQETHVTLTIHADPTDMGKIIGRNGRIIHALRDLLRIAATKHGQTVDVVLEESQSS